MLRTRSSTTRCSDPSCSPASSAPRSATGRSVPTRWRSRSTGSAPASARGTSSFPRSWGGLAGVEAALPRLAELGFDIVYLPPIHPIGHTNRKGRDNALIAGPADPGSPWAIGDETGGHEAVHPELGTKEDLFSLSTAARELRDRHRARLRDPVLGRPPVADRAPRVVSSPPRRNAQVRREPAQALPGHLQRQLGVARLAGPVAGAQGHRDRLGRLRGEGVPRRQPAHEAVPSSGSG